MRRLNSVLITGSRDNIWWNNDQEFQELIRIDSSLHVLQAHQIQSRTYKKTISETYLWKCKALKYTRIDLKCQREKGKFFRKERQLDWRLLDQYKQWTPEENGVILTWQKYSYLPWIYIPKGNIFQEYRKNKSVPINNSSLEEILKGVVRQNEGNLRWATWCMEKW